MHNCGSKFVKMDLAEAAKYHGWPGVSCDKCKRILRCPEKTWHCVTCGYDNCEACYRGHKFIVGQRVTRPCCSNGHDLWRSYYYAQNKKTFSLEAGECNLCNKPVKDCWEKSYGEYVLFNCRNKKCQCQTSS